jgi:hypothetical protein
VVVGVNADNTSSTTQRVSSGPAKPPTKVPVLHPLRHSTTPAQPGARTAAYDGQSATRRGAPGLAPRRSAATKSLERPSSGAAAAHSAGLSAAAARASSAKRTRDRQAGNAGIVFRVAANLLRPLKSTLPLVAPAGRSADNVPGLLPLFALLCALLLSASWTLLGGSRRRLWAAWGRRR